MRRLILAAAVALLALPAAAQAQDYGPNTCLQGFVWRDAFAGDTVCVKPMVRVAAKFDNAAAPSRRDASTGYGAFGCQQGFVWREAREDDLVCVTPAVRDQANADNAAAAQRRNSVKLSLGEYFSGNLWRHRVDVSHINLGQAYVGFFAGDGKRIAGWYVNTSPAAVGGRLSFATNRRICDYGNSAYFRVKDMTSTRWSQRVYVRDCA